MRTKSVLCLSVAAAVLGSPLAVLSPAPVAAADVASVDCAEPSPSSGPVDAAVQESFEPQTPERIVDTRNGNGGVDEALDAGCTLNLAIGSLLPSGATGVALSLTVTSPDVGFFTAFPCAAGLPTTSNVNARSVAPTANLVLVEPDADGNVCVYSSAGGDVIVDVAGSFGPGPNRFESMDSERAADTRRETPAAKLAANSVKEVDVTGGVVPDDAAAVVVNLIAVQPESNGFMVAYPCGGEVPLASVLNFVAGENRAASSIVAVGNGGRVCVSSNATTHVIVDVTGYYAPSDALVSFAESGPTVGLRAVVDTRVADTRTPARPGVRFGAGTTQTFDLSEFLDDPNETVAVALNLVAVRAEADGYVTVYPCTDPRPTTSSLNYGPGQTPNLIVTKVSEAGEVCVYASTGVDMAIDLFGAFATVVDAPVNGIAFEREVGDEEPPVFEAAQPDREFDDGNEYGLPCGVDGESVRVTVNPADGVSATVNGQAAAAGSPVVVLPVGGVVTVTLASGPLSRTYSFRCTDGTPPDFPEFTIGFEHAVGSGFDVFETDQDFDGGSDYTFRCAAGGENVRVTVDTSPDVSVRVNDQDSAPGENVTVAVSRDGLLTVTLGFEDATQSYHYRCLPPDFPRFTVDTTETPAAGWYTYSNSVVAGAPNYGNYLIILDQRFVPVWFKNAGNRSFLDFRGLSDGNIVAAQGGDGGFGVNPANGHNVWGLDGNLIELRQTEVPPVVPPDYTGVYPTDFHEYEEIQSASGPRARAVISYPPVNDQDLREAKPVPFSPPFSASEDIVGNVIQEFDGAGNLTWNWDIIDHFGYDEVSFGARTGNGVDPFHVNSIDRVDEPGCEPLCDYVVSARHLDSVFRIDRATGDVEWILSSSDVTVPNKDGAPRLRIEDDIYGGPKRQHDARLVGDRLTLFDNQTATPLASRVAEYRIDTAAGTATLTRNLAIHPDGETSAFAGSGGFTPDGSVLVAWTVTEPLFVEYDAAGNELQRLTNDPTDGTYRIHKFASAQFSAAELRATAGGVVD